MRKIYLSLLLLLAMNLSLMSDEPPNPGGGPGSGDLPVGGSAPLNSAPALLLMLAAGYAAGKTFIVHRFGKRDPS